MWSENWNATISLRLSAREHITTESAVVAREQVFRISDGCSFHVEQPRRFQSFGASQSRLASTRIQFLRWETDCECETSIVRSASRHILLHIPLRGSFEAKQAGQIALVKVGQALLVGSAGEARRRWHGGCELLNLIVSREALARVLTADFGIAVEKPIAFSQLALLDLRDFSTMLDFVELVDDGMTGDRRPLRNPVIADCAEKLLLMLMLSSLPHSYEGDLQAERSVAVPFYIRRAENYLQAKMAQSITMQALCNAASVSARTLHYGFQKYRRQTPMKYLKGLRLAAARKALISARNTGTRVSDIALTVGYRQVSQFNRDYKARFGESPGATRRRQ